MFARGVHATLVGLYLWWNQYIWSVCYAFYAWTYHHFHKSVDYMEAFYLDMYVRLWVRLCNIRISRCSGSFFLFFFYIFQHEINIFVVMTWNSNSCMSVFVWGKDSRWCIIILLHKHSLTRFDISQPRTDRMCICTISTSQSVFYNFAGCLSARWKGYTSLVAPVRWVLILMKTNI